MTYDSPDVLLQYYQIISTGGLYLLNVGNFMYEHYHLHIIMIIYMYTIMKAYISYTTVNKIKVCSQLVITNRGRLGGRVH